MRTKVKALLGFRIRNQPMRSQHRTPEGSPIDRTAIDTVRWTPEGSPIDRTAIDTVSWTPEGSPIDRTAINTVSWTPEGSPLPALAYIDSYCVCSFDAGQ